MITVICPVFNEENYISDVISFFIHAQPESKELIIIDGGSTDKTCEIVLMYSKTNPQIKLFHNKDRFVPFALNAAIRGTSGDPVIRLDAHTKYADDYFTTIIETFRKTDADIVGGPMRAVGNTHFQKAVAIATSTSFGIGDSAFHDATHEGYVDSVYLGAWKRKVFEDVGFFDTDMIRNQDDEFHYRAKSKGKRIYLNPAIISWYYPRNSLQSLIKQYYQYGLFKPLVIRKVKSGIKVRHLIPAAFVIYLFILFCVCVFFNFLLFYVPMMIYLLLDLVFSIRNGKQLNVFLSMLLVYPALHLSYGAGFIKGTLLLWADKKPKI